jgi:hypothetical protein
MAKRKPKYPAPTRIDSNTFETAADGLTMRYRVAQRGPFRHTVLLGTVNGETRLECDMTTTAKFYPNRFWDTVHEIAYTRLREVAIHG